MYSANLLLFFFFLNVKVLYFIGSVYKFTQAVCSMNTWLFHPECCLAGWGMAHIASYNLLGWMFTHTKLKGLAQSHLTSNHESKTGPKEKWVNLRINLHVMDEAGREFQGVIFWHTLTVIINKLKILPPPLRFKSWYGPAISWEHCSWSLTGFLSSQGTMVRDGE